MKNLIQIIYISRSTFAATDSAGTIEPNVARILAKSRSNNRIKGLVGVLYFGDGCFFQCLEGEESTVDTLYKTLLEDSRHKDLKLLSRKMISELSFPDWSMKYVGVDNQMKHLLSSNGYKKFDPYAFDGDMVHKVMGLLHLATDPSRSEEQTASTLGQQPIQDRKLAKWAIFLSSLALAISLGSFLVVISK
ncbi:MAG TPA: BLUF domain-containing protein [Methylophilaceae bacterium]